MTRTPVVYILASRSRALYVGFSTDLPGRLVKHKTGTGHTGRCRIDQLVYVESHDRIVDAIAREKQIKSWRREKKVALIESVNPSWHDLSRGALPGS